MAVEISRAYVLGGYRLEPDRQQLLAGGQQVRLARKHFEVLLYLVEHRNRFVSTAELLERFWQGKDVYDDTVRKTVAALRKALGDGSDQPRFIETRWGYGYRYVGPFAEQTLAGEPPQREIEPAHEADCGRDTERTADAELAAELPRGEEPATQPAAEALNVPPAAKWRLRAASLLMAVLTLGFFTTALMLHSGRSERTTTAARTTDAPARPRSVAVLPLKNLTNDAANDYLCDGLTENLINALTKIKGLKVIARGSVFSLKGQEVDSRELGQRLGVETLLQGGVFRDGKRLRVEVRLMSAADGRVLWAGAPYERKLGDIFALQDELARNVVAGIEYKLEAGEEQRLAARHTKSVEAYQAYLKGRYHWNKRNKDELQQALAYFREALRLDPNYAQAYAGIADYYNMGVWYIPLPPREATAQAKAAALRAVALDDELAEAHLALGRAQGLGWAWADALRKIELALELDPGSAEAHHAHAYALLMVGQPDRAVAEIRQARELDPLSVTMNVDVGEVLLYARHYAEAEAALRHAIELEPSRSYPHWDLGAALQMQGRDAEAFEEYMRDEALKGSPPEVLGALREAYQTAGMHGYWQKQIELLPERKRRGYVQPSVIAALLYAQLGDHDRAFAYLEEAYREHSPLVANLKLDPLFDPLRADSRFAQLVARLGQ